MFYLHFCISIITISKLTLLSPTTTFYVVEAVSTLQTNNNFILNYRYNHDLVQNLEKQQQQQQYCMKQQKGTSSVSKIAFQSHNRISSVLLLTRGGGKASDYDDDDEEEDDLDNDEDEDEDDDDDDDEMLLDFDNDQLDNHDTDFGETTTLDRFMVAFSKTPPVTKLYLSISLFITLYGYVCTKNEFPSILLLQWDKIITRLQFWRILTSFFHFGPFGLGYIMTLQFVWVYMSTLERIHHHRPYDFWIMILFGQLCMVIGYPIMKLSPKTLGHNLSTFLVYIWSRYHEGQEVNMFELFNTRAELLPWFFLGQTFLLEGEVPLLDFLGIVFGHIYHHCKTVGILRAPPHLTEWYETSDAAKQIRELYKPISSDFDVLP